MDESLIDEDFASFSQQVPPTEAELKAEAKKRAAAEKAAAPKGPTKAQMNATLKMGAAEQHAEELEEKLMLVRRIKQYHAKFGDRISTKLPKTFGAKQTLEELKEMLRSIELDLSSAGATMTCTTLLAAALQGVQHLSVLYPAMDVRLSGPRADLMQTFAAQQSTWMPIVEEFAIKYERWFAVGVEKRALFYIASLVLLVNRANKESPEMERRQEEEAPEEVLRERDALFSDLAQD